MPNRMLKDTIRTSKNVGQLTDFQFRLWIYLISYVDDYGRGSADAELLKGFLFPRRKGVTETQIEDALTRLANLGMIVCYDVDGDSYFYFPNWSKHQRIQAKASKFPDPPTVKFTVANGESPSSTVSNGEPPSSTVRSEDESVSEIRSEIKSESVNTPYNPPSGDRAKTAKRFSPPSVQEVGEYCKSRNNGIDAQQFVNFYESKGWRVGKEPMKDWKAAVRTWEGRRKEEKQKGVNGFGRQNEKHRGSDGDGQSAYDAGCNVIQ